MLGVPPCTSEVLSLPPLPPRPRILNSSVVRVPVRPRDQGRGRVGGDTPPLRSPGWGPLESHAPSPVVICLSRGHRLRLFHHRLDQSSGHSFHSTFLVEPDVPSCTTRCVSETTSLTVPRPDLLPVPPDSRLSCLLDRLDSYPPLSVSWNSLLSGSFPKLSTYTDWSKFKTFLVRPMSCFSFNDPCLCYTHSGYPPTTVTTPLPTSMNSLLPTPHLFRLAINPHF